VPTGHSQRKGHEKDAEEKMKLNHTGQQNDFDAMIKKFGRQPLPLNLTPDRSETSPAKKKQPDRMCFI